jgi:hypothetical protein
VASSVAAVTPVVVVTPAAAVTVVAVTVVAVNPCWTPVVGNGSLAEWEPTLLGKPKSLPR